MSTFFDEHYGPQSPDGPTRAVYRIFTIEQSKNIRYESRTGIQLESAEACYHRVRREYGLPPIPLRETSKCHFCGDTFSFNVFEQDGFSHGCAEQLEIKALTRQRDERLLSEKMAREQLTSESEVSHPLPSEPEEGMPASAPGTLLPFILVLGVCLLSTALLSSLLT